MTSEEKKKEKRNLELARVKEMISFDKIIAKGTPFVGVDEVGRGPLAGSVCACAIVMPENFLIEGINDSKKLSPKKRISLYEQITSNAIEYSIAMCSPAEIDELNILNATRKAMQAAVSGLKQKTSFVLVDGNDTQLSFDIPHKTIVEGDAKSFSIACASIVAKVTRDRLMEQFDEIYPEYDFKQNKGYGTKKHIEAIRKYGLCPIHRTSFTKNIMLPLNS